MSDLNSRPVILITGASSGIGLEAALTLSRRDWQVFATVRKAEDGAPLQAAGIPVLILDYAKPQTIADTADLLLAATGGRIDALFNNGAYGQPGAVEDLTTDVLRAQFEANFFGWHDLTRRLIPAMRARGFGRIVQCSSILGFISLSYRGAYTASKHALEGLTNTLRLELAGSGIDVISIQPGPIDTRFVPNSMEKFHENIDIDGSVHRDVYHRRLKKMREGGRKSGKLPPSAVVDCLIRAVEARRPRPVYRVNTETKVMSIARRLLSTRAFVWLQGEIGRREQ